MNGFDCRNGCANICGKSRRRQLRSSDRQPLAARGCCRGVRCPWRGPRDRRDPAATIGRDPSRTDRDDCAPSRCRRSRSISGIRMAQASRITLPITPFSHADRGAEGQRSVVPIELRLRVKAVYAVERLFETRVDSRVRPHALLAIGPLHGWSYFAAAGPELAAP